MVGSPPTMSVKGYGELVFDSGQGALKMASTSKKSNMHEYYPLQTQGDSEWAHS